MRLPYQDLRAFSPFLDPKIIARPSLSLSYRRTWEHTIICFKETKIAKYPRSLKVDSVYSQEIVITSRKKERYEERTIFFSTHGHDPIELLSNRHFHSQPLKRTSTSFDWPAAFCYKGTDISC